jgi:hypothetical protein
MWRIAAVVALAAAHAEAHEGVLMHGAEVARGIAGGIPRGHVVVDIAGDQVELTLSEAMDSYVGDFCDPRRPDLLCGRPQQPRPNYKALRIMGAGACYRRDRDEAIKVWNRLGQMDRQFVKYICNRNGIEIP